MAKFILVLLIGLVLEALGVALLSKGLKELAAVPTWNAWIKAAITHPCLLGGLALETAFFGILLYLLAQRDVSFIWPLTALGFVITTFMARFALDEYVPPARWAGVLLIVLGAAMVSWTEARRPKTASRPEVTRVISQAP